MVIALIIAAFLGLFYSHKHRAPKRKYSDFHCFYVAGQRFLNQENIYVLRDKETAEFRYAPIFAMFMSGLALLNEDAADTLWYTINFCLLILSFLMLHRLVIRSYIGSRRTVWVVYAMAVFGVIRFMIHNLDVGQTNILMLASMLGGIYYIVEKKNEVSGGMIFAFSIMIKYTPLVFLPYFILRRRFKLAFIIMTCVAVYLVLPSLFVGIRTNFLYLKSLVPFLFNSTILDQMTILDPKNQSLLSMVYRFFTNCIAYFHAPVMPFQALRLSNTAINFIFMALATIIYLSILYCPKRINLTRKTTLFYDNIDYALLIICVALFNLNSWQTNYILLSAAYFIIAYYLMGIGRPDRLTLVLLVFSFTLNFITIKPVLGKVLAYKLYFYSPFTLSALITLLALLKIKFFSREEEGM